MAEIDLTVHDIAVSEQTTFAPGGGAAVQKRVSYFVGTHGPFTLVYNKADGTAARIKADIQAQVDDLRSVHEIGV